MNCEEIHQWLVGHLDGELDPVHAAAVEAHLQKCPACAAAARQQSAMRELVREKLSPFAPPAYLATRVRAQLREEGALEPRPRAFWRTAWTLTGVLAACGVALLSGYHWGVAHAAAAQFSEEVVSDHVRALATDHLTDVVSSDRHTVKPWLSAKLDFSPPVVDLAADGFPLLGGRLERLGGQPTAALVYRHGQHFVTVLVCPAKTALPVAEARYLGYTICAWRQGGMNFVAVSDMADDEMDRFTTRLKVAMN